MRLLDSLRKHRSWLILGVALVCGAVAAYGARGYIDDQVAVERHRLQPQVDEVEVVVARRDLHRGDRVGPDTMAVRRIPSAYVPGTAVRPDRFDEHIGARLTTTMRSGEPLLAAALETPDSGAFSTRLREGVRAMTIAVDEVNALSGMLQPGDRIDLQISVRPPQRPGQPAAPEVTTSLMQDILVLATGRQMRATAEEPATGRHFTAITVEVTPDQAQRLIVAQRGGRLTALLRNRDDRQAVPARALDIHALIGVQPPPPMPPRRAAPEVIVGGKGPLATQLADAARSANAELAVVVPGMATSPSTAPGERPPSVDGSATAEAGAASRAPAPVPAAQGAGRIERAGDGGRLPPAFPANPIEIR